MRSSYQKRPILERFQRRIFPEPNTGCWLWGGRGDVFGYGNFHISGDLEVKAHRFSYTIFKGEIPQGLFVCHSCDQPACVNPEHLFLGTQKDNINDRDRKGREQQVFEIRELLKDGVLQSDIAVKFNVSKALISCINRKDAWASV